jgi:hypothetical protein
MVTREESAGKRNSIEAGNERVESPHAACGKARAGCGELRWILYEEAFSGCPQSWMLMEIVVPFEWG